MFKDLFKPAIGTGINPDPHYSINIGSVESFERKPDDAQKDLPASDKISGSYVKNQTGYVIL